MPKIIGVRYYPNDGYEYRMSIDDVILRYRIKYEGPVPILVEDQPDGITIDTYGVVRSAESMARVVDAWLAGGQEARAELSRS